MKPFLFALLLIPCFVFTQPVTRRLADRDTRLPVAYATVKVLHTDRGQVATGDGRFTLALSASDSLRISCVGYEPLVAPAAGLDTLILLSPRAVQLDSLVLRRHDLDRRLRLGTDRLKMDIPWGPANTQEEFAQRFDLPADSATFRIDTVFIPVRKPRCQAELLLHIYDVDSATGAPGKELFMRHFVIGPQMVKNGIFIADLTPARVLLDEGHRFFVSVSWPPPAPPDPCFAVVLLSSQAAPGATFSRTLRQPQYGWFPFGAMTDRKGGRMNVGAHFSVVVDMLK